jgi:L-ascorbate metabolism protein UlaG (beta-lactamase superfamily)
MCEIGKDNFALVETFKKSVQKFFFQRIFYDPPINSARQLNERNACYVCQHRGRPIVHGGQTNRLQRKLKQKDFNAS